MASRLLDIEGYSALDPQSPLGGPDGKKDILCEKDYKSFVVGCYFPCGQKTYSEIKKKFKEDLEGVEKNKTDGFVFFSNQKITPSERIELCKMNSNTMIYHGEKVLGLLDSPRGYGVRLEYLGIELTKEEQISFLNSHLDLKQSHAEIQELLEQIKKSTSHIAGQIEERDRGPAGPLSTLPVAGIAISSRISAEDLFALHFACLYDSVVSNSNKLYKFRNVQTWIGAPGCNPEDASFTPPPPEDVPELINELLVWWREKYMDVVHSSRTAKIVAIAEFHHRILSIHPFLDGNGRLARVISSIQFTDLVEEEVKFEKIENVQGYYEALESAADGDQQALIDIFMALAK